MKMGGDTKQWVAVTVLVVRGDRVLCMCRSAIDDAAPGLWEGVSGRVEAGEEPLHAARREVIEETGLRVRVHPRPIDTYAATRRGEPMTVLVFRADYEEGEVVLSGEHDAHRWCALPELSALGVPPRLIEAAQKAWVPG